MSEQKGDANLGEMIDELLSVLRERRWVVLTATFLTVVVTTFVVMLLPNRYTSEAVLVVTQPQVAQRLAEPSSNTSTTSDLVKTMSLEVLSRSRLLDIIRTFDLFPDQRSAPPEMLAERLRRQISIEPLDQLPGRTDFSAFRISLSADSPALAQQLTSRLTSLFIEENLKTRGKQASATNDFINSQLQSARQRLNQQEQRLRDFKQRYLGQLPEQTQINLDAIADLRTQVQDLSAKADRLAQQRASLEATVVETISRLRKEKTTLLERFTPKHPEVFKKEQEISKAESLLNYLRIKGSAVHTIPDPSTSDDVETAKLKQQAMAITAELQGLLGDQDRLRGEISRRQEQLKLTPVREQQLTEILRDYDLYKQDYKELQTQQLRSQMTSSLEEQYPGKMFRLIDEPTLPSKPSSPKRLRIVLGAFAVGLGLGLVFAFGSQLLHPTFRTERDLARHLGSPLIVAIPLMVVPQEQNWRWRKRILEWIMATAMILTILYAELYVYRNG